MTEDTVQAERIKALEEGAILIQQKLSEQLVQNAELRAKLISANASLSDYRHRVRLLRDGLKSYLPGPFWDTVLKDTKADMDRGKHAEYVLRLTASEEDPEGA